MNLKLFLSIAAISFLASCAEKPKFNEAEVKAKSGEIANQFQDQLQAKLGAAMKADGPVKAIDVCQAEAPMIGASMSAQTGAQISRISLKNRNPAGGATGDALAKLEEWSNAPLNEDKTPKTAVFASTEDGIHYVNYMRAIPMKDQPCATCHGENIKPEVAAKIKELYPLDKATGFKEGDLRGAFLVKWPLTK